MAQVQFTSYPVSVREGETGDAYGQHMTLRSTALSSSGQSKKVEVTVKCEDAIPLNLSESQQYRITIEEV